MDCRTARHFLAFARPRQTELEAADLEQLQGHLAVCAECDAIARSERLFDEHIGKAMANVPTPQGLRERLLERLKQERDAYYRKWIGRFVRVAAAAAAVLLITWGAVSFFGKSRDLPAVDSETVARFAREQAYSPLAKEDAEAWFDKHKVRTVVPPKFDYNLLAAYGLGDFHGHAVPQLTFVKWNAKVGGVAQVFVLSSEQFNLDPLPKKKDWTDGKDDWKDDAYGYKVRVVWHPQGNYAYVVKYNGKFDEMLVER